MEKYLPSNGTEGSWFVSKYCEKCKNEKFMHTQDHNDKQCPIFNKSIIDDEGPDEWVHTDSGPKCLEHKPWDWSTGEEPPVPPDPNQLNLFKKINKISAK